MKIKLDYGENGIWAEIPDQNLAGVLRHAQSDVLIDPAQSIADALENPIGSAPLAALAAGKTSAIIVICDITRPVPNKQLLPQILESLNSAGLPSDQVTILIATGTHRPNEGKELEALVGAEIASTIRCVNHVCTDSASLSFVGTSPNGVPVWLNTTYLSAELRITVGLIEPHFMAGFSGGRKLIMPGIAGLETVQKWHSPRFLEHPNAAAGIIVGNPVHEESLAIAMMARPDMVVDVTLNESNEITGVFAGDLEAAWHAGTEFARDHVRASLPEPVDIVVTTCAGAPLDATYYQAVKGMVGALPVVKLGGSIIIAAECSEGIGSSLFQRLLFEADDLGQWLAEIQSPSWKYVQDQWEVEMLARVVGHANVICVTDGISDNQLSQCFATPCKSVEIAIQQSLEKHGPNAKVAVIPKGPYVIAHVAN